MFLFAENALLATIVVVSVIAAVLAACAVFFFIKWRNKGESIRRKATNISQLAQCCPKNLLYTRKPILSTALVACKYVLARATILIGTIRVRRFGEGCGVVYVSLENGKVKVENIALRVRQSRIWMVIFGFTMANELLAGRASGGEPHCHHFICACTLVNTDRTHEYEYTVCALTLTNL